MAQSTLEPLPIRQQAIRKLPVQATPALNIQRHVLALSVLSVALIGMFLLVLAVGSVTIPFDQIITILLGGEADKASWTNIVLKFRLPKALTALLAGAALSVSGLMMQTFFRNPLAGPFILGISSGASLGVALVVLSSGAVGGALIAGLGLTGDLLLAGAAAIGASITMLLVIFIARRVRSSMTLLIVGLMFGYFTGGVVSLLMHFTIAERVQAYINWTFGSFGSVTWSQLAILLPVVGVGLLSAFLLGKSLNALLLGERYAQSMGLNTRRARFAIIITTGLLAGTVTAFCGPIGFIGIAVPHVSRSILGTSDHRALIPASVLIGGIATLIAALIAEVPGSNLILPLNAVTALIGAPVVMWVILRRQDIQSAFES